MTRDGVTRVAAMLPTLATALVAALAAAPVRAHDPAPASRVTDDHKYYTLTVYQNNEHKSFDDNFIDMENAEVKSGMYWSTVKRCLIFQTIAMQSIHMVGVSQQFIQHSPFYFNQMYCYC